MILGDMDFNFQMPDMTVVRDAVQRAKAEAMRASDEARKAASRFRIVTTDGDGAKVTKVDLGKATISFSDEHGELTLERVDGKKMLTATDADGKSDLPRTDRYRRTASQDSSKRPRARGKTGKAEPAGNSSSAGSTGASRRQ